MKEFFHRYFTINLNEYENIGINCEINIVMIIFFLALSVSFFVIYYHKSTVSVAIKQLLRHEAFTPESAKTLKTLHLSDNRMVKRMLKSDGTLTKMVKRVGETEFTYEEYLKLQKEKKLKKDVIDFENALFYVKNKDDERVKKIFNSADYSIFRTFLMILLIFSIFVCLTLAMPEILTFINNLLGNLKR